MLASIVEEPATLLWLAGTITLGLCILPLMRSVLLRQTFPIVNVEPGEWTYLKAKKRFIADARGLLKKGAAEYGGKPFTMVTSLCDRVILPPEYTEFVKGHKDLDHQAQVATQFFSDYPGFEAIGVVGEPEHKLIDVVKIKMTNNMARSVTTMTTHMAEALKEIWGNTTELHEIDWSVSALSFISAMSSAIFVGPKFARNPAWQAISQTYTVKMFNASKALREWPAFLRPLIVWILPASRIARQEIKAARRCLAVELAERAAAKKQAVDQGEEPPVYNDSIEWMEQVAHGRAYDPAVAQLAFAMAALHTTTELLKQALLDIVLHGDVVHELRREVADCLGAHGWTPAGLYALKLLDSCVKETFRLKPGSCVSLERMALKDIPLPDGTVLRKGSMVAVDSARMWDPNVYDNPNTWDPHRFVRMAGKDEHGTGGSRAAQLVSSSPEHMGFGLGRFICPGRFFAANEVKVALASILSEYDVAVVEGARLDKVWHGFDVMAPFEAKLLVKRRT